MSIEESPNTELAGVVDAVPAAASSLAEHHGSRIFDDPQQLIESPDVDAVLVGSPTDTHVDLIRAAVTAGKPVLCEKPIDLDMARVEELRPLAMAASTPVMVGFNRRFDTHFAELHRRVRAGDIGRLEQLAITSRDPAPAPKEYLAGSGGIFRDMTIHDFDMARNFVPDVVSVFATGSNLFSEDIRSLGDHDSVIVVLTGREGEQVTITNSRHASYGYDQRLEAFGSEGLLEAGNVTDTVVRHWGATAVEVREPYQNFFLERYRAAYRNELEVFVSAVKGEDAAYPGFHDGWAALVLADAAALSAQEGRVVTVDLT